MMGIVGIEGVERWINWWFCSYIYLGSAEKVFPGGRSQESGVRSQEFQALLPLFFVPSDVLQEG